jgi:hypothetical protein
MKQTDLLDRHAASQERLKKLELENFEKETCLVNSEAHFLKKLEDQKIAESIQDQKNKASPNRFGLEKNKTEADLLRLQLADKDRIIDDHRARLKNFQEIFSVGNGGNRNFMAPSIGHNLEGLLPSPVKRKKISPIGGGFGGLAPSNMQT